MTNNEQTISALRLARRLVGERLTTLARTCATEDEVAHALEAADGLAELDRLVALADPVAAVVPRPEPDEQNRQAFYESASALMDSRLATDERFSDSDLCEAIGDLAWQFELPPIVRIVLTSTVAELAARQGDAPDCTLRERPEPDHQDEARFRADAFKAAEARLEDNVTFDDSDIVAALGGLAAEFELPARVRTVMVAIGAELERRQAVDAMDDAIAVTSIVIRH